MKFRTLLSLVLSVMAIILGGCSTTTLRDGTEVDMNTVFNLNHAHSLVTRWQKTDRLDANGQPIWEQFREERVLGADQSGRPIIAKVRAEDKISGPSVVGQMAGAAAAGTGAALINGDAARSVAEKGSCRGHGANCGTVINTQSVANALNENKVDIKVESGGRAACAANNTCGR